MKFVELRKVATDQTFIDLPDYRSVVFDSVWNPSPSSFTVEYPYGLSTSLGLAPGAFISVVIDGVFEVPDRFVIEKLDKITVTDNVLMATWSGRSMKAILEDDFVWPSAWPNPKPAGHGFVDNNAGTIMKTFLTRSNQRGFMTVLDHSSFSGTSDSSGSTWSTLVDRNFANGQTILQVLQNLYDAGMVETRTNGFALELYKPNNLQRHLSINTVCFTAGDNIADESASVDSTNFFTDVFMEGEEAAQTATNTGTYAVLGRRRSRYSSVGGVSDPGTLSLLASSELGQYTHLATEQGLGVTHQNGSPQPFIDYRVGDWVWLDLGDGTPPVEIQVQQISVRLSAGSYPEVSLSLGDLLDSADEKLKRRIDAITGGNSGNYGPIPGTTASANIAPAAPTGLNALFGVYLDDKGVNRVAGTFTWNTVNTNSDGTPASDIVSYELYMRDDSTSAAWQLVGKTSDAVAFYSPLPERTWKRFIVYAVDSAGLKSAASSEFRTQTPNDTTPPTVPSAPTAPAPVRGVVTVSWDGNGVGGANLVTGDFSYVSLYRSTTSNFTLAQGTQVATFVKQGTVAFSDQVYGQTYYYRLTATDVTGNQSALSAQLSAVTQPLVRADIGAPILADIDSGVSAAATAAAAQQTANTAQTTANGRNKIFTGSTTPTATTTGDMWVDTGNGNIIKIWSGSAWVAYQDAAIAGATTAASGKNKIFMQGTTPTATAVNDTWLDTANGNVIKVWNGTTWVLAQDAAIAAAQTAATGAQTTANGKSDVTYSTGTPGATANSAGDIWFQQSANQIIAQWVGMGGTTWQSVTLRNEVIATLDAAKITTGYLDALRIAANSIGVKQLVVGDTSNMATVNESIATPEANIIETTGTYAWSTRSVDTGSDFFFRPIAGPIPFAAGDRIRVTFDAYSTAGIAPGCALRTYNSANSNTLTVFLTRMTGPNPFPTTEATAASYAYEGVVSAAQMVSTQTQYVVSINGAANGGIRVRNVRAYVMNAGKLLVQGSIVANDGIIATAAIGNAQIADLAVTNAKIAALDAAKITTGFLDVANRIQAGSLVIGQVSSLQTTLDTKARTFTGTTDTLPTTGMTTGDIYLNSTTGHQWVYSGTAWVSVTDVTKSTTFTGTTDTRPTSGMVAGDVYMNTANGKQWVYSGTVWVAIVDPTKSKTFTGTTDTTPTTGMVTGDIYANTTNGRQWIYSGTAWISVVDTTKSATFTGTTNTTPTTGMKTGDIYMNTSTGQQWVYSGTAWVTVIDVTKSKSLTGTTDTTPTTGMSAGDTYANTTNGKQWVYSGTAWVAIVDPTKSKTFTGTTNTTPASGMVTGDIYTNTATGKQWIYSGTAWITTVDTTKSTTFTGTTNTLPVSGMVVGDNYMNTTTGQQWTYASTGWVAITDPTKTTMTAVDSAYGLTKTTVNAWMDTDQTKINGGVIQTGTVLGNVMVAHTMGADQMVIGGVTNLMPDGYGEYGTGMTGSMLEGASGVTMQNTDLPPSSGVFAAYQGPAVAGSTRQGANRWIDVEVGQEYLVEIWLKASLANSRIYVEMRDELNAHAGTVAATGNVGDNFGSTAGSVYLINNFVVPTVWTKYTSVLTITGTSKKMRIGGVYFNHTNGTVTNAVQNIAIRVRQRGTGQLIVDGSIWGKSIIANSMSADRLATGTLSVDATIYAGDPTSSHAEVSGSGFYAYTVGADGLPSLAVRMGTSNNDLFAVTDTIGETQASISDTGFVSAHGGSIASIGQNSYGEDTGLTVYGQEFTDVINASSGKTVAQAYYQTNYTSPAIQSEMGICELSFIPDPRKSYMIWFNGLGWSWTGSISTAVFAIRYTTDGSSPTVTSSMLDSTSDVPAPLAGNIATSSPMMIQTAWGYLDGATTVRMLLTVRRGYGSGDIRWIQNDGTSYPRHRLRWFVTEAGFDVVETYQGSGGGGVYPSGTPDTPPPTPVATKQNYVKTYQANGFATYRSINGLLRGSSASLGDTNRKIYQGYSSSGSYNGDQRGLWTFPSITGDVGAGTITKVEAYIYFDHWYYNSGGTAWLQVHNYAVNTWPTASLPTFTYVMGSGSWPKPGGRWITLPSSLYAGFKAGTYKGFGIGPAGSTSLTYYGYADDVAYLRVSYTK